jgi:hypothetical protein
LAFHASPLVKTPEGAIPDLASLLIDLAPQTGERYLGWAVLHACERRFGLAELVADAAAQAALLITPPVLGVAREARLLQAQLIRLQGGENSHVRLHERLRRALSILSGLGPLEGRLLGRVLREQAALTLEIHLQDATATSPSLPQPLDSALEDARRAEQLLKDDPILRARTLQLLLCFGLVKRRNPEAFTTAFGEREMVGWHEWLVGTLADLRERGWDDSELSRRVRAAEIVGFRLFRDRRPPPQLRIHALALLRRFLERMQENQQVRLHRECTPKSRKILMALDSLYRMTE